MIYPRAVPAPDDLATIAAGLEAEATKAELRGETKSVLAMLWYALRVRRLMEPHAVVDIERLTRPVRPRTVNSARMEDAHKVEMSRSRATHDKKFMAHIRAKGYSLNRLAEAVKMAPSSLSQARRKPTDPLYRRIPDDKAERIETLTGWPAKDWP